MRFLCRYTRIVFLVNIPVSLFGSFLALPGLQPGLHPPSASEVFISFGTAFSLFFVSLGFLISTLLIKSTTKREYPAYVNFGITHWKSVFFSFAMSLMFVIFILSVTVVVRGYVGN